MSSRNNFFDLSMFKKLTFAEPRMLKLGWWGGHISTRILSLFKKPNYSNCTRAVLLAFGGKVLIGYYDYHPVTKSPKRSFQEQR